MTLSRFILVEFKKSIWRKKFGIFCIIIAILFFVVISNFFASLPILYERWHERNKVIMNYGDFFTYFCINLTTRILFVISVSICSFTFLIDEHEKPEVFMRNVFFLPKRYCYYFLSKLIICNFSLAFQFMLFTTIFYFLYTYNIEPFVKQELKELTFLSILDGFLSCFIKTISVTTIILNISIYYIHKNFYTILICLIAIYVMSLIKFSPSYSLFEFNFFITQQKEFIGKLTNVMWVLFSLIISHIILSTRYV